MAATERSILAASLLMPGLAAVSVVHAEEPPEQSVIGLKYGWYRDWQPGFERVKVSSPQLYLLTPFATHWSFEGSAVVDSVSGATPRMHTIRSSATPFMSDRRKGADVKVTRYFHRATLSAGMSYSGENDYGSHAQNVAATWSTEDNNRTFIAAFGHAGDRIDATKTGGTAVDEHRRTRELMLGVNQVASANDLLQVQFTRSLGRGFYNDPYKLFDARPDARRASIALLRWNHHIEARDATLRTSWRYYEDSFGIRAHTLSAEWAQPWGAWTFTPALRYHAQSAASFYFDPVLNTSGQPDFLATRIYAAGLAGYTSADQRLGAFGAITASIKVVYEFANGAALDLKLESYKQAANLKPGGGSPNLEPFRATFVQLGWSKKF